MNTWKSARQATPIRKGYRDMKNPEGGAHLSSCPCSGEIHSVMMRTAVRAPQLFLFVLSSACKNKKGFQIGGTATWKRKWFLYVISQKPFLPVLGKGHGPEQNPTISSRKKKKRPEQLKFGRVETFREDHGASSQKVTARTDNAAI